MVIFCCQLMIPTLENGNITLRQGVNKGIWMYFHTSLAPFKYEAMINHGRRKRPSTAIQCCLFHDFWIFVAWGAILWFHVSSHCGRCQELTSSKYPWGKKRGRVCVECYDNGNLDVDVSGKQTHKLHTQFDGPGNQRASSMLQEIQHESWDILGIKGQSNYYGPKHLRCMKTILVSADGS